jgi:peptide/nickel transport system permease protein
MPRIARIVRSQVLSARELVYVEAATALGIKPRRIIFRHILPNIISPVVVQGTFVFAYAVLNEAALSFLGVGVPPMIPTWGNMLSEGRDIYQIAWWYMLFPGSFIVLVVFAINMVGDGLRDIFDPLTFSNK